MDVVSGKYKRMQKNITLLICFFFLFFGGVKNLYAGNLENLKKRIGRKDAILVADHQGNILLSKNAEKKLMPASTLKILTSLSALHYLGEDFRFQTEFYTDKYANLKIKGYGDPLLISEVVAEISRDIGEKIGDFNDLVLDNSYFDPIHIPGVTTTLNPYDAPIGALCVNFNTVFFKRKKNGVYASAEPQTPLLPFALRKIRKYGSKKGRVIFSQEQDEITLYAGHLFQYFLKKAGVRSDGKIRMGSVDRENDRLVLTHISQFSLADVIRKLLEYSNNFIANQTMVSIGAKVHSSPGTLKNGVRAMTAYVENVLNLRDIRLAEGSGISRENRVSAKDLHRMLEAFEPHHALMCQKGREFYKTGSLTGVKTRAGYIESNTGGLYRFAVMINTPRKSTNGVMSGLLRALP